MMAEIYHYPGYDGVSHPGHIGLRHLREGRVLMLEGVGFRMVTDSEGNELPLGPGVTYIGARNTIDVYTAREVDETNGWVCPEGIGYPFDLRECVPVEMVDPDQYPPEDVVRPIGIAA